MAKELPSTYRETPTGPDRYLNSIINTAMILYLKDAMQAAEQAHQPVQIPTPEEGQNIRTMISDYYKEFRDRGVMYETIDPKIVLNPIFTRPLETARMYDEHLRTRIAAGYFSPIRASETDTQGDKGSALNLPDSQPYTSQQAIPENNPNNNQDSIETIDFKLPPEGELTVNPTEKLHKRILADFVVLSAISDLAVLYRGDINPVQIQMTEAERRQSIDAIIKTDIEGFAHLGRAATMNYFPENEQLSLDEIPYGADLEQLQASFNEVIETFNKKLSSPAQYFNLIERITAGKGILDNTQVLKHASYYPLALARHIRHGGSEGNEPLLSPSGR
jgi:hypothetical protein